MILVGGERERQQKPPYLFVHKNLLLRKTIPGILYAYENNTVHGGGGDHQQNRMNNFIIFLAVTLVNWNFEWI